MKLSGPPLQRCGSRPCYAPSGAMYRAPVARYARRERHRQPGRSVGSPEV